jgi:hypothetical protein
MEDACNTAAKELRHLMVDMVTWKDWHASASV